MLTELKRYNSIGTVDGLLFLISILRGKSFVNRNEIINRVALENHVTLNANAAIAFFSYLGYVNTENNDIAPTDTFNSIASLSSEFIIKNIVSDCISKMFAEGIFDTNIISFDPELCCLKIRAIAFPLTHAVIRNFLITVDALNYEDNGEIIINSLYEYVFSELLRERNQKITLEQLLKTQQEQNQRGLEAEEFVLAMEQKRIPCKANMIKRISDVDVAAGYDIISFNDETSSIYDRFIEVKSYIGSPHFYWSENEVDTAKIKGNKYILCLVNYEKIKIPGYIPEIIEDPYNVVFKDDSWLVSPSSYIVKKI